MTTDSESEDPAEGILRRFPSFPSLGGGGPVQLARVLAGMGEVGLAVESLGRAVMTGPLVPMRRELAILRVAWRLGAAYIWGGHARIAIHAKLDVGLERTAPWPDGLATLVVAVDELLDLGSVTAATRGRLCASGSDDELLQLTALVGTYRLMALIVASCGLESEPGSEALPRAWPGPEPR